MILVKLVASLEGVAVRRDKWWRVGVENCKSSSGLPMILRSM
jgi:hypothetical protein